MTVREFIKSGMISQNTLVAVECAEKGYTRCEFMGRPESLLDNMDSWYQRYEIKSMKPEYFKAFYENGILIEI